jgi:glycosyltransferase involved in cell wall biosynthesis
MRIALVHDDLVQWGGAERTFFYLTQIFPDADIYTSVYDKDNSLLTPHFVHKQIRTSFLQKIPGWKALYKIFLPLYPIAFEQFDFSEYNIVISSTTRFAKSIITKPGTTHICYCHTPPRFLYSERSVGGWLKRYDLISSQRVDKWIAGSKNAQSRLKETYGVDSEVIYPPVDTERLKSIEPFDGGYLLIISRLNKYKRVDLAVKAANYLKLPLKVVGVGPESDRLHNLAGPTVQMLGSVSEDILIKLLAGCKALLVCGEEDFGLTPLEAQALGKPVVAYKKGGARETVIDGVTGYLFDSQTVESLKGALDRLEDSGYDSIKCRANADRFSKAEFKRKWYTTF